MFSFIPGQSHLKALTTAAATRKNKKVIAQCTGTGSDMKWLHRLLCDLGLAGWMKRNHEAGMTVNHTRTQLLRSENGQLELRILAELEPMKGTDE